LSATAAEQTDEDIVVIGNTHSQRLRASLATAYSLPKSKTYKSSSQEILYKIFHKTRMKCRVKNSVCGLSN
jgi:hypothetical protein